MLTIQSLDSSLHSELACSIIHLISNHTPLSTIYYLPPTWERNRPPPPPLEHLNSGAGS